MLCTPVRKTALALLHLSSVFVAAYPAKAAMHVAREDEASLVVLGEHASYRTIVIIFLLALAQGQNDTNIRRRDSRHIPKVIELAEWEAGREALDILTSLCLHKVSSVLLLSLPSVSTRRD